MLCLFQYIIDNIFLATISYIFSRNLVNIRLKFTYWSTDISYIFARGLENRRLNLKCYLLLK